MKQINTSTSKLGLAAMTVALSALSASAQAGVVAAWDFENAKLGQISGIAASSTAAGVSNASFNTGNNGVEPFGGTYGKVSATRYFNNSNNTPSLTFTLAQAMNDLSLSFTHFHNHNAFFPTAPGYKFAVQINNGDGWLDLATNLLASAGTNGSTVNIDLKSGLSAGTHSLRWIGYGYASGNNSSTEYFALNNVALSNHVPEPASLALVGLALAGVTVARRRKQA
ncbi:PEP-CTERM sorting domain-containing protein [Paucibacter sp. Y2R2-4]|uniref:PEP-CTERM sorting domain-containing protein n=1 Tax=Paucibacter sp. Y2R2-4 TaxID=2893553 RepID=UPI0021E38AB5|nr:PEP-CTERM sorting domain-containing protein [Paucibacter sp. Y2R2-4]MCV2350128.1 PEP-CTERM sorting domain-containing protein [Paucibacter sp. Y2R2-4]